MAERIIAARVHHPNMDCPCEWCEHWRKANAFSVEGWTELEAMNALQDHGIISDGCVWWSDVGNKAAAIEWLEWHEPEKQ